MEHFDSFFVAPIKHVVSHGLDVFFFKLCEKRI